MHFAFRNQVQVSSMLISCACPLTGQDRSSEDKSIAEERPLSQQPIRIEMALYVSHRIDLPRRIHQLQQVSFEFSNPVFGGHSPSQRNHIFGKIEYQLF